MPGLIQMAYGNQFADLVCGPSSLSVNSHNSFLIPDTHGAGDICQFKGKLISSTNRMLSFGKYELPILNFQIESCKMFVFIEREYGF